MKKNEFETINDFTKWVRRKMINMAYASGNTAHFGAGLSIVEILAVLYTKVLNIDPKNPTLEARDRFILSKGHGVLSYYAVLAACGFFEETLLETFQENESDLIAHPVMNLKLGIETSNGSLGHGLSVAIGSLIASKRNNIPYKAYVLMGNGECNEGSVWEAAMFASSHKLSALTAIIDNNSLQSDGNSNDIIDMLDIKEKWEAFGWEVIEVDGHNTAELERALCKERYLEKPRVIIANTIKGKGISFMENDNEWHHSRLNEAQYKLALSELKE